MNIKYEIHSIKILTAKAKNAIMHIFMRELP